MAQTTAADFLPAATGQNLGNTGQRWNLFANGIDIAGATTITGTPTLTPGLLYARVLPPVGSVTATAGIAGSLSGTYQYSLTYVTANGETERGPLSGSITVTAKQVNLTVIPVSPDSSVTARRIYRNANAATDFVYQQLVGTIADNVTTTFTDNVADGSLGAGVPYASTADGVVKYGTDVTVKTSNYQTTLGLSAMPNNTGYANVAIGQNAMTANTTGVRDTAVGMFALFSNTTGSRNTGVGVHALNNNVTNNDNTALGYGTLLNATADGNTAVGANAANNVTSGGSNTAVGWSSQLLATTGSNNVAVGFNSLENNLTGVQNTAIGTQSLQNTTANFNTAVGMLSAVNNTSGSQNVAVGFQALNTNSTGSNNVALGNQAGYYETGANHLWIDNTLRANLSDAQGKALIYGTFNTTAAGQAIALNAAVSTPVSMQIGATGTAVVKLAKYTATLTPASVAANTTAVQTFTITGVAISDTIISVVKPTAQAGLGIVGWYNNGTNSIGIVFSNNTGSPITPTASELYAVTVIQ